MRLYHGSSDIVEKPRYGYGSPNNDYGSGFYLTEDREKAKEWACVNGKAQAICNQYELDMTGLTVCNLDTYGPLAWIAEILVHRDVESDPDKRRAAQIVEAYRVDTAADVVIGYRADDSYLKIIESFLHNEVSVDEVYHLFFEGQLGHQIFLKSEKAFGQIRFLSSEEILPEGREAYGLGERDARKKVFQFLNNRQNQILDGHVPKGLLAKDVVTDHYLYQSESGNYIKEEK